MKVMVIVKATKNSEAGVLPTAEMFTAMLAFNEKLVKAGVMQSGDGLKPSKAGKRVRFTGTGGQKTDALHEEDPPGRREHEPDEEQRQQRGDAARRGGGQIAPRGPDRRRIGRLGLGRQVVLRAE